MVIGWVCRRQSEKSGTSSRAEFTSLLAMGEGSNFERQMEQTLVFETIFYVFVLFSSNKIAWVADVWEQVREVDGGALAFLDSFMIGSLME